MLRHITRGKKAISQLRRKRCYSSLFNKDHPLIIRVNKALCLEQIEVFDDRSCRLITEYEGNHHNRTYFKKFEREPDPYHVGSYTTCMNMIRWGEANRGKKIFKNPCIIYGVYNAILIQPAFWSVILDSPWIFATAPLYLFSLLYCLSSPNALSYARFMSHLESNAKIDETLKYLRTKYKDTK